MDYAYENLKGYNATRKIPDMKADFKLSPIVTKLFLRHKKLNILLGFI